MNGPLRIAILLLFAPAFAGVAPSFAADPPTRTKEPFEDAVDRGLSYLVRSQNRDGSWSAGRGGTSDPAVSALAVMAFLSSGHIPGEGPHGEVVEKGVRYVMSVQTAAGTFTPAQKGPMEMYYQGICTLMLAEVVGMMPDRFEADKLRTQLVRAIRVILAAQRELGEDRGGWRYAISGSDADISVTGWQIMALRAAKNVGCDIPPEAIERAVGYFRNCFDPLSGGYRYQRSQAVTVPCTGAAILSLELCGSRYHRSPEAIRAGGYLLRRENQLSPTRNYFFYGVYYTSQAMFQLGDNYWKSYRESLHEMLLRSVAPREVGFWLGRTGDDAFYGPAYCTSMAILSLTVEYRLLPIYQRDEGEKE